MAMMVLSQRSILVFLGGSLLVAAASPSFPGCFIDSRATRQLNHQICLVDNGCEHLTVEWCGQQCRVLGFALAGVEASHQCCCGHVMASPTAVAPATDCSEPCTGNASETCGASLRVWVFTVDSIPPPPPSPPPVPPPALPMADPRYIPTGRVIVTGGYACQPYCVTARVAPDSATLADSGIGGDTDQPTPAQPTEGSNQNLTWTCVMTYNALDYVEGTPGEHMISTRSSDQGKTWSPFVSLEPYSAVSTDQVSAYGSIGARADGSRLVAYWIQNTNNVSHVPDKPASASFRADMLGEFVWKYSDDGGISWSDQHYVIPVPKRFIDRGNTWNGTVQIMWQVDHMKTTQNGSAMFAFTKIGTYAVAPPEEIYFLFSPNLLSEADPTKVSWEMWPDGDHGVQAIGGTSSSGSGIAEEPHIVPLTSVAAYAVVFRTSQGYLGSSRSALGDPAAAWRPSSAAQYLPPPVGTDWLQGYANASGVKNPRGPISPKRQPNGLVLMTYYNNAGFGKFAERTPVSDRCHMWLTVGHEKDGDISWCQPELVLYDRERSHGHGYPDIITDNDAVFITETYKSLPAAEAKTHPVPSQLVQLLYSQRTIDAVAHDGIIATFQGAGNTTVRPGSLPDFRTYPVYRYGFTFDGWLNSGSTSSSAESWAAVVRTRAHAATPGVGSVSLHRHSNGTAWLRMVDGSGMVAESWTDPVCSARLGSPGRHHLAAVVDGGPRMVLWVVDGHLCDGGPPSAAGWPAGWTLFDDDLGDVGAGIQPVQVETAAALVVGRLYGTALYTTECIGNWRAGFAEHRAAFERETMFIEE